jgi:hypothetical protein
MKKLTLALTALLLTNGAFANDADNQNLTLAAADIKSNAVWVETLEDVQLRLDDELTEKADVLNAQISLKLQQQLELKVTQELGL